jgi:hypothetical protein
VPDWLVVGNWFGAVVVRQGLIASQQWDLVLLTRNKRGVDAHEVDAHLL